MMAERDKEEMELDIAKMEFDFKGTAVICRSGIPLILADLKKVSILALLVHIISVVLRIRYTNVIKVFRYPSPRPEP